MFTGDETWIYYFARPWGASEDEPFNPDNFVAQPIVKTTIGTTPEGSEWAKVNLPSELVGKQLICLEKNPFFHEIDFTEKLFAL